MVVGLPHTPVSARLQRVSMFPEELGREWRGVWGEIVNEMGSLELRGRRVPRRPRRRLWRTGNDQEIVTNIAIKYMFYESQLTSTEHARGAMTITVQHSSALMLYLIFLIVPFFCIESFGQSSSPPQNLLPKITPSSPEVAAFAKYGNYEVNLFNGTPNISIPLHEVVVGELRVPISINYNASGIRVSEVPSNIGTGWSLSAGGAITRKVMGGMQDEYLVSPTNAGYFGYLNGGTVKSLTPGSLLELEYFKDIADRQRMDTEPDIFSYSMPGKGGKFVFSQEDNLKPFFIPFEPLKVSYTMISPSIMNLAMIDESGINYQFNDLESSSSSLGSAITSSWQLSKMISSNGRDIIKFRYSDSPNLTLFYPNDNVTVIDGINPTCTSSIYQANPSQLPTILHTYNTISQKKLDSIVFRNGKVVFQLAPEAREDFGLTGLKNRMQKILVYSLTGSTYTLIKEIEFYHSYFIRNDVYATGYTPASSKRLKLDKLVIKDAGGNPVQEYNFGYNSQTGSLGLPDQNAKAIDFWGYFNGKFTTTLVPRTDNISYTPYSNGTAQSISIGAPVHGTRNPDPAFMQSGMLNKITYPTGGYTLFTYETNRYLSAPPATTSYAGGLRISKIENFDGISSTPVTKTYVYGENESGYGLKNFVLDNYFFMTTIGKRYWISTDGLYNQICTGARFRTFLSNPTADIEPWDAAPVAYPFVTEYIGDGTSNIGKTIYQFNNQPDGGSTTQFYGGSPYILSNHYHRGQVLFKSVYKRNPDNSYTMVAQTENKYGAFPDVQKNNSALSAIHHLFSDGVVPGSGQAVQDALPPAEAGYLDWNASMEYLAFTYTIQSGDKRPTKTIERTFNPDGSTNLSTTTDYYYDNINHMQTTRVVKTGSKGESITESMKYPHEFALPANVYQSMVDKNILNKAVETKTTNSAVQTNLQKVNYADWGNNNLLPQTIQVQVGTNPIETRANFLSYDLYGSIQSASKTNDMNIAYLYGYKKTLPIAEANNAINTKLVTSSNSTGSTSMSMGPLGTSVTFTVGYAGLVKLKLGITTSPAYITYADYSGSLGSGTMTLSNGQSCGYNHVTFNNIAPGTYTITIVLRASSGTVSVGACGQIEYPAITTTTTGISEIFYENFEEGTATGTATPHTGRKYLLGDYTNTFIKPNTKNYVIEYWYLNGAEWVYASAVYTNGMVLTNGSAIDNVRIYPSDAQMKSYTYDPLIGMTSAINESGQVFKYEYDSFGRLKRIVNDKGSVEKEYTYNYKTN
jgi:YD repeat-containing protein